jgi:hypothetical protein
MKWLVRRPKRCAGVVRWEMRSCPFRKKTVFLPFPLGTRTRLYQVQPPATILRYYGSVG